MGLILLHHFCLCLLASPDFSWMRFKWSALHPVHYVGKASTLYPSKCALVLINAGKVIGSSAYFQIDHLPWRYMIAPPLLLLRAGCDH